MAEDCINARSKIISGASLTVKKSIAQSCLPRRDALLDRTGEDAVFLLPFAHDPGPRKGPKYKIPFFLEFSVRMRSLDAPFRNSLYAYTVPSDAAYLIIFMTQSCGVKNLSLLI